MKSITINEINSYTIQEPLIRPFGFKGFQISELWQAVSVITGDNYTVCCPATQSVLWSDGNVFAAYSPEESNMLMYKTTVFALEKLRGMSFTRPDKLILSIIPEVWEYANYICKMQVRETFVLNSLVGVDIALWMLYARENGINSFDGIIPEECASSMNCRHGLIAHIPLVSYNVDEEEITSLLKNGTALIKLKLGKTMEWDTERLLQLHTIAKDYETPLTKSGKVCYYVDANGRYNKDDFEKLIDFADKNNILERIAIIEEPFDENDKIDVSKYPVIVNADESAHSPDDLDERIALGYRSVALKPIAKTLSVSFLMVEKMKQAGGMYLCADLTVNPLLAEFNKQFAARIAPLSAMNVGCVEVNGDSNYTNWESQIRKLPSGLKYTESQNGRFICDNSFYEHSDKLFCENGWLK